MRHKRACHVCPQVYPACYQVLPGRTCGYPSWTLYALVIILSFQALFPRLLRKCGVAVSARLVCRKTRQAVSRVLSGMAGICLSGIFTVFFFLFFVRGVLSFHLLGPQTFLVRAGFFFLQAVLFHGNGAAGDCAHSTHKKKSVVAQSVLLPRSLMPGRSLCLQGGGLALPFYSVFSFFSTYIPAVFFCGGLLEPGLFPVGCMEGAGFPVVVWRCKRGRKEGLICLRTEKKKKQKKSDFF